MPGTYQPRTRMDEGSLYELAESIKTQGIMQPILVRRLDEADGTARLAQLQTGQGEAVAVRGARPCTKSLPASGGTARPAWLGWTACRCWCATSATKPLRPWRSLRTCSAKTSTRWKRLGVCSA